MEGTVAGNEKKVEEASKVLMETGKVLKLARTRVEAAEREVSGMEQQLKEAWRRLTINHEAMRRLSINQERSALTIMEERDALVRKGNACQCQDLRRQQDKLREARRWEDEEEKKEAMKQQRIRKAEREACVRKAAEEADVKSAILHVLSGREGGPVVCCQGAERDPDKGSQGGGS